MQKNNDERNALRRMKRYELVEMIYALRKRNLELEDACTLLQRKLAESRRHAEHADAQSAQIARMRQMIQQLYQNDLTPTEQWLRDIGMQDLSGDVWG